MSSLENCLFYLFPHYLTKFFLCLGESHINVTHRYIYGFPDGSDGKEFTCNAGDPGSIPGSGRSIYISICMCIYLYIFVNHTT